MPTKSNKSKIHTFTPRFTPAQLETIHNMYHQGETYRVIAKAISTKQAPRDEQSIAQYVGRAVRNNKLKSRTKAVVTELPRLPAPGSQATSNTISMKESKTSEKLIVDITGYNTGEIIELISYLTKKGLHFNYSSIEASEMNVTA